MIAIGDKLKSDFSIKVVRAGETDEVKFKDLFTRRTIVSVFMRNNTSSCDKQTASLAKHAKKFDKLGYNLVAVSRDTGPSQKKYAEKMGINYALVSDPEFKFTKAADAIVDKTMYGQKYRAPARAAYVFETDGTVLALIERIDAANHAEELFELLKTLGK